MKFYDAYEISRVHEYTANGESLCEPVRDASDYDDPKASQTFWTLYGITEGQAEALVDRDTNEAVVDILSRILGVKLPARQAFHTIYPVYGALCSNCGEWEDKRETRVYNDKTFCDSCIDGMRE